MRPPETVRSEQIRALFRQSGPVLWANVAVAAVVVGTLWSQPALPRLLGWFSAVTLLTALRWTLQREYVRQAPGDDEIASWGRRFVLGSTASGVLWGAAGVLFFQHDQLLVQSFLAFAIGGMNAAAAGTLSCYLPAFTGYFLCAMLPLTTRTLLEGDHLHIGMGAMLLVYIVGIQRVARNNNAAFIRAFQLSLENTDLLKRLSVSQVELREVNQTLEERVVERTNALTKQGEQLQKAQRLEAVGRLAGGLAHDFNSLLTVIINDAGLLRDTQPLDEQGHAAAAETLEAAQRGAALIRQLLALSRRKRAEPQAFSLRSLVCEWAHLFERIGKDLVVELDVVGEALAMADPGQVEQVLVAIVARARASMPGGGRLRLSTSPQPILPTELKGRASDPDRLKSGEYVELVVESYPHAPHVGQAPSFDYGSLTVGPSSRNGGASDWTSTVAQWGGHVVIDSLADSGERIRVLIPAAADAAAPTSTERLSSQPPQRGATILVVDDEKTLRSVLRRALSRAGYQVLVAENGQRALALFGAHADIDLLITDVMMPDMSGIELSRQLRLARPGLRVLFISGFTFEETVPSNDLQPGTAFLPKPFETSALTEKVTALLAAHLPAQRARSASTS